MDKKTIIANWKMNLLPNQELALYQVMEERISKENRTDIQVGICPSYLGLALIGRTIVSPSFISLGAQDVSSLQSGAYTGEIFAGSLRDMGCEFVLIGHSERRRLLDEEGRLIKEKALRAKEQKLRIVLCIGENKDEKNSGLTFSTLSSQIEEVLGEDALWRDDVSIAIAYEPVWSIGTGEVADSSYIADVMAHIASYAHILQGKHIDLLYGGSVDEESIKDLAEHEQIHGFLVGGASLNPDKFLSVIRAL